MKGPSELTLQGQDNLLPDLEGDDILQGIGDPLPNVLDGMDDQLPNVLDGIDDDLPGVLQGIGDPMPNILEGMDEDANLPGIGEQAENVLQGNGEEAAAMVVNDGGAPRGDPEDLDLIMQAIESDKENDVSASSSLPPHVILPSTSEAKEGESVRLYEPSTSNANTNLPPLVYIYNCENKTFLVICKVV